MRRILSAIMRLFGYFRVAGAWRRPGDRVLFTSKATGTVVATVDECGGLYVIVATDFDEE